MRIGKNKKNLNKLYYLLVLILSIFILILVAEKVIVLDEKQIEASFTASDHAGFDLNKTALTFGKIPIGQSGTRKIGVENTFPFKTKIEIRVKGNISRYLIVSENDFYLNTGDKTNVTFSVYPPEDLDFGEYSGKITIIQKRF